MKITSNKNLMPLRVFGVIFLLMAGAALVFEGSDSTGRVIAVFLVSYFFWGMSFSTAVDSTSVTKKRGWFFPYFTSKYDQLKRIELRTKYIHQQGPGVSSYYALYVGIINGVANEFVDLSWGVKDTESSEAYREFVNELQALTNLPVSVNEEFATRFEEKFGLIYAQDQ